MADTPFTVQITKTVPVDDVDSLAIWLGNKLNEDYSITPAGDGIGIDTVALITEAGFKIIKPRTRKSKEK